jgi:polyhydroxybutyrate depolymerase
MKTKTLKWIGIIILLLIILGTINKIRNREIMPEEQILQEYTPGDYEFTLIHGSLTRVYKVHVPSSYDVNKKNSAVIYLHGGGGNKQSAYRDGLNKMSDKYGFILIAPEGTGEVKVGQVRAVWNGGMWKTGECCGNSDDTGFLSKMIEEIENNFNIDKKRIYATGISNGGLMTNRIGCELANKIAAIATVAPAAVMSNCNPSRSISVINIHGTADPANPPDGSEPRGIFNKESGSDFAKDYKKMTPYQTIDKWKEVNECSNSYTKGYEKGNAKCIIYNECLDNSEIELCIVEKMGHTYPGGSQYLPNSIVGPVSHDISFDQIWEFFNKHPMK